MDKHGQQDLVFNARTGSLCFWVPTAQGCVPAYLSASTWWASHGGVADDSSMMEVYLRHRDEIDASVLRRVRNGARTPVVLMASDL